jgi:hypothetical protein
MQGHFMMARGARFRNGSCLLQRTSGVMAEWGSDGSHAHAPAQPPRFGKDLPYYSRWVNTSPSPCSWWKYKGVLGNDPNLAVYVTPHVHQYFMISPTPLAPGLLPPSP